MSQPGPSDVLVALARLVSEATSLKEVVARVAESLRSAIPFQRMHLLRLDRADSVVLYSVRASGELEVIGHRIRGVTEPDALHAGSNIDPHARSVMICPLR